MKEQAHRAPQEKVCGYEYTVRRGDSFYLIANRLGIPLRDLLEANSDINPARLMVGDVLCIPMEEDDAPQEPAPPESPEVPIVPDLPSPEETPPAEEMPEEPFPDSEDNLDAPATMPEGNIDEEISVCPEANRYTVHPGETIADVQLRADINRFSLQQANPSTDLDALHAGQMLCVPEKNMACPVIYQLHTDDTLESIALRLNTSLAALLRANPCLAPSDFIAGQCIHIPE